MSGLERAERQYEAGVELSLTTLLLEKSIPLASHPTVKWKAHGKGGLHSL